MRLSGRQTASALRRLGPRAFGRENLPYPGLPAGTDTVSQIRHIVILMMENHSYDNYLGTLAAHGDGLPLGPGGEPAVTNPAADGSAVPLRRFPGLVQCTRVPSQSWHASHLQWDGGRCDGFVRSIEQTLPGLDATVPMTYWTESDLPFYHWLARTFPLATRWFCSCLGPTFPNRRFLTAGTAHGLIDDLPFGMIDYPPAGTLFDLLDAHGISWVNYHHLTPVKIAWRRLSHARGLNYLRTLAALLAGVIPQLVPALLSKEQVTADLYPLGLLRTAGHLRPVNRFWADAAAGDLPAVSIVDPDFKAGSEENPQDIGVGEAFAARVYRAVTSGPGWPGTLLAWLYDEHGGYYDHVPPPQAPPPDDVPGQYLLRRYPLLRPMALTPLGRRITEADEGPGNYDRLGFRVPAVVVSPYARPGYVSDRVYDHTSLLKLIERKWNLPPLTRRDAAAADPIADLLDLDRPPAFLVPPQPPGR